MCRWKKPLSAWPATTCAAQTAAAALPLALARATSKGKTCAARSMPPATFLSPRTAKFCMSFRTNSLSTPRTAFATPSGWSASASSPTFTWSLPRLPRRRISLPPRIKRRHGWAASSFITDNGAIEIASVGDRPPRAIFPHMLTDIIEPRAMELLSLIRDDLQRAGLDGQIPAGFILAGGGARLRGLDDIIEQSFRLPVRIAEPKGLADLPGQVAQPEYATVVGLVLAGAKARRSGPHRSGTLVSKLKAMFAGAS